MRNRISLLFLALVLVCLSASSVMAQINATATLQGTVTDKSGAVIPSAEVKATSKQTNEVRSATSNGSGLYSFNLLSAGIYEVRVTVRGFSIAVFENVELSVGRTTTIDAQLSPSAQADTVTVEAGGAALVDMTKTDVSLPITTQQIEDLPLNGRDFVNLAYLAPGARPVNSYDPTKNRIGVFAVDGSSGRNVNVTVNGVDDKDNTVGGPVMQLPLEAVQEFQISTQRFSAANGRSEGALITAITKSGTNTPHGSLYLFDRNQAMNANDYFSEQGGSPKPDYGRQQFGGSIGGAVRKDTDFLFFAIEREREATSIAVNPTYYNELLLAKNAGLAAQPATSIPEPYFDWRYNGRWDHHINDKNNIFASYSNQHNNGLNDQSASNNDLTAGNFTTNQLILASINLNSVISPTVVNAATVGYQYWNNLIDSTTKVPTVTFGSGEYFGTNGNVPQQSFQRKWQFKDDLSITKGKHNFKVGFDYLYEPSLGGFFEFTPTPAVTFFDDPSKILSDKADYPLGFATPGAVSGIAETAGNPYFLLSAKMFGVYFQDDWKVSRRLTVNLGLRWDKDFNLVGGSAQSLSRTYLELKAIGSSYAAIPQDDNKDFSPRVGFAYDLTGKGKHVVRGGFGIYYGQTFENIPLFMIQQSNPTIFATTLSLANPSAPQAGVPPSTSADLVPGTNKLLSQWQYGIDPLPVPPPPPTKLPAGSAGRLMDPSYHNPYTEQENIGYAWSINDSNVIEVDYVHVLGLRENKNVNINPKNPNITGAPRILTAALSAAGQPVLAGVTDSMSVGRSRYDGFNVAYRRRLSKRVSLNTSYVLSRALSYRGAAASYSNAPSNVLNYLASYDFGPTPSDERHRWVLSGVVKMPWGIQFAPIMQLASARPYNPVQGVDYFGYGTSGTGEQAVLLKSDPNNFLGTAKYSAAQVGQCLSAGNCFISTYDAARGIPFFQFDARFSKGITLRERMHLEFFFQAFNLTNRANFGGNYSNNIRSSAFGQPAGFIAASSVVIPQFFAGEAGFTFRF
ncbi:MAG TPA: carboxypeptidase regulatory-like domain-containing protein [Bryobacteraceae bacterium]|nr:carboxypeptidase regulatory-like domain-containing protein [Bryobacteraceae bacterium]